MPSPTAPLRCLLILLILSFSLSPAQAAAAGTNIWTSLGPEGGDVYALAIDPATPTTLYAGIRNRGVYKSTDSGGSWSASNTGLTNLTIQALAIDPATPATVYAGTAGGVFKSTDGGAAWNAITVTLPSVHALAIDPATSMLYVGVPGAVLISSDGSAT